MSDHTESQQHEAAESTGISRRSALKMGVAAGVGVVAWSGPTITSLGGTPVYAAGCTFVQEIDLSAGCRNTAQANCGSGTATIKYLPLAMPPGYADYDLDVDPPIPNNGWCNNDLANQPVISFSFPTGMTCQVHMDLMASSCGTLLYRFVWGDEDTGAPTDVSPIVAELPDNGALQAAPPYTNVAVENQGTGPLDNKQAWIECGGCKVGNGNYFYRIYAKCATTGAPLDCLTDPL